MPNSFVAATQPSMKGIAPGKAPTNTESGVFCFKGVYKQVYINVETLAKKAVLILIK